MKLDGSPASTDNSVGMEACLREVVRNVSLSLKPNSHGILCRKPLLDQDYPEVSDIDIVSIWDQPDEFPERRVVDFRNGEVFVDVLWTPLAVMIDPVKAARYRTLPHMFLESEPLWFRSGWVENLIDLIKLHAHDKVVWEHRLHSHMEFGDAALNEAVANLDFPEASLFFLQAAHSFYLIALADSMKKSVMSLRTRPMGKLRRMAGDVGDWLEEMFVEDLHLNVDPPPLLRALRKMYRLAAERCRGSPPLGMNPRTRGHYLYSISPSEMDYREMVAGAMIRRGDRFNAVFYIRFWAYCISRCPVVLEASMQGRKTSFYTPYRPFRNSLEEACPEIIDELALILGGGVKKEEVEASIERTSLFRDSVSNEMGKRGLCPTSSADHS